MNVKLKIEELENEVIFLRQTLREDFEDLYKPVSYTHLRAQET